MNERSDGTVVFSTELDESGLKSALNRLESSFSAWMAGIAQSARTALGAESGEAYAAGYAEGLTAGQPGAAAAAERMVRLALNRASELIAEMVDVGYQSGAGLAQGLWSSAPLVAAASAGLIGMAAGWMRKKAEINSPAKLFAREVGAYIPAGVAEGVDANAWQLREAVNAMIDGAAPQGGLDVGMGGGSPRQIANASAPMGDYGLSGIRAEVAAAVWEAVSGIEVYMDGTAVGHLVSGVVSRDIQDEAWEGRYA